MLASRAQGAGVNRILQMYKSRAEGSFASVACQYHFLLFNLKIRFIYSVCELTSQQHLCRGQRTTWSWFFPSSMWISGIKPRLSDLVTRTFSQWATSGDPSSLFWKLSHAVSNETDTKHLWREPLLSEVSLIFFLHATDWLTQTF